jgi:DNA-binding winged helix-turn-helix (wHTH) protein
LPAPPTLIRFGAYQLDVAGGQLLKSGRVVRLKPQPFKLLQLLASRPGEIVTREEIRLQLWGAETFVDFEQGVNTAIKQIRDALKEDADRPLYLETVPKRGYRFIAPVETDGPGQAAAMPPPRRTDLNLAKALWLNVAELQLAEARRLQRRRMVIIGGIAGVVVVAIALLIVWSSGF